LLLIAKRENNVLVAVEAGARDFEAPIDPDLTLIEGASHAEAVDSSRMKRNIVILMVGSNKCKDNNDATKTKGKFY
jgi:hypothetical protein